MSEGNSHLSLASSHGNTSTSEHFHPPTFLPWTLQKEQEPQRRDIYLCVFTGLPWEGQRVEAHTALWEDGLR